MNDIVTIDFSKIEGPVYTGRNRGERLRIAYGIDALDSKSIKVHVLIPEATYSISSSFFLGMFGPSVVQSGSKDAFYKRFEFVADEFLKTVIDGHVSRALQDRNLFS